MKRLYPLLLLASLALGAAGQVQYGDLAKWGIMRKSETLRNADSMSYTAENLRVIESVKRVDTNTVCLTVLTNLVITVGEFGRIELPQGVYLSTSVSRAGGVLTAAFADGWTVNSGGEVLSGYTGGTTLYWSGSTIIGYWCEGVMPSTLPVAPVPVDATGGRPEQGYALADWRRYTESVTNDFVSATRLQDAIDDIQQDISEAIEAHVQLMHQ